MSHTLSNTHPLYFASFLNFGKSQNKFLPNEANYEYYKKSIKNETNFSNDQYCIEKSSKRVHTSGNRKNQKMKKEFIINQYSISKQKELNDELETIDHARSSYRHPKSESMATSSESGRIFQENLRKERRAHTLAPSQIITGPIDCPASTIFSSLKCSMNIQPSKPVSKQRQYQTNGILSCSKSEISISDLDDKPIVVKVRYDPEMDILPSEQAIRQLIDHQLQQTTIDRNPKQPIVLNFLNRTDPPKIQQTKSQSFPFVIHSISDSSRSMETSTKVQHRSTLSDLKPSSTFKNYSKNLSKLRNVSKDPHLPPKPSISHLIIEKNHNRHPLPNLSKSSYQSNNNTLQEPVSTQTIDSEMATSRNLAVQSQVPTSGRTNSGDSSNEIFHPAPLTDVPELSKDSLLKMLNQIPDLKGRRFNIEYALAGTPQSYPIPLSFGASATNYPEPVVIDKLPNNIIQHVKTSNNPALVAALDAAIKHDTSNSSASPLKVQQSAVTHHASQQYQSVQESRPVSSNQSEKSSIEVSSSSSSYSSSEETETESEESEIIEATNTAMTNHHITEHYSSFGRY